MSCLLLTIPREVFALIRDNLDYWSARALSRTSKQMSSEISLLLFPPPQLIKQKGTYKRTVTLIPLSGNSTVREEFGDKLIITYSCAKIIIEYKGNTYLVGPIIARNKSCELRTTESEGFCITRFKSLKKRLIEYRDFSTDWPDFTVSYGKKIKVLANDRIIYQS